MRASACLRAHASTIAQNLVDVMMAMATICPTLTSLLVVLMPDSAEAHNATSQLAQMGADAFEVLHEYAVRPAITLLLCLLSVFVVLGNMLVVSAIWHEPQLHSVTNYLIGSLAAADCLVGAVVMPFSIISEIIVGSWTFGATWCDLWHSFDVLASTASIINLCAISADRYLAITNPITYPTRMTPKRVALTIVCIWTCSSMISFPAILWWRAVRGGQSPLVAVTHRQQLIEAFPSSNHTYTTTTNTTSNSISATTQNNNNNNTALIDREMKSYHEHQDHEHSSTTPLPHDYDLDDVTLRYTCPFTDDFYYLLFSSFISFYGPLCIMLYAYYRIYKAAVRQTRFLKHGSKQVALGAHDKKSRKRRNRLLTDNECVCGAANGPTCDECSALNAQHDGLLVLRVHRGGGGGGASNAAKTSATPTDSNNTVNQCDTTRARKDYNNQDIGSARVSANVPNHLSDAAATHASAGARSARANQSLRLSASRRDKLRICSQRFDPNPIIELEPAHQAASSDARRDSDQRGSNSVSKSSGNRHQQQQQCSKSNRIISKSMLKRENSGEHHSSGDKSIAFARLKNDARRRRWTTTTRHASVDVSILQQSSASRLTSITSTSEAMADVADNLDLLCEPSIRPIDESFTEASQSFVDASDSRVAVTSACESTGAESDVSSLTNSGSSGSGSGSGSSSSSSAGGNSISSRDTYGTGSVISVVKVSARPSQAALLNKAASSCKADAGKVASRSLATGLPAAKLSGSKTTPALFKAGMISGTGRVSSFDNLTGSEGNGATMAGMTLAQPAQEQAARQRQKRARTINVRAWMQRAARRRSSATAAAAAASPKRFDKPPASLLPLMMLNSDASTDDSSTATAVCLEHHNDADCADDAAEEDDPEEDCARLNSDRKRANDLARCANAHTRCGSATVKHNKLAGTSSQLSSQLEQRQQGAILAHRLAEVKRDEAQAAASDLHSRLALNNSADTTTTTTTSNRGAANTNEPRPRGKAQMVYYDDSDKLIRSIVDLSAIHYIDCSDHSANAASAANASDTEHNAGCVETIGSAQQSAQNEHTHAPASGDVRLQMDHTDERQTSHTRRSSKQLQHNHENTAAKLARDHAAMTSKRKPNCEHEQYERKKLDSDQSCGAAQADRIITNVTARQHRNVGKKLSKLAKERKAAKTLGIVVGVFIACWLPFFIFNILVAFCGSQCNHVLLFQVFTWLGWLNSAMNPVIYACWSRDFRRAFRRVLCSWVEFVCPYDGAIIARKLKLKKSSQYSRAQLQQQEAMCLQRNTSCSVRGNTSSATIRSAPTTMRTVTTVAAADSSIANGATATSNSPDSCADRREQQ